MDVLESIWHQVAKPAKDGKKYVFFKDQMDVIFLYATGFVDAKKFTCEEWIKAFEPSKLKNGSFAVSEAQWMEKKKYHYSGPVNPPFDPLKLEDREYTEAEFATLLREKVIPSTIFDEKNVPGFVNNLKAQGRLVNGKMMIDRPTKEYMLQIVNQYPSPMRVLEISVHGLHTAKKGLYQAARDTMQKSAFTAGQTAQQITAARLAQLSGAKPAAETAPAAPAGETLSLKDLQKRKSVPSKI